MALIKWRTSKRSLISAAVIKIQWIMQSDENKWYNYIATTSIIKNLKIYLKKHLRSPYNCFLFRITPLPKCVESIVSIRTRLLLEGSDAQPRCSGGAGRTAAAPLSRWNTASKRNRNCLCGKKPWLFLYINVLVHLVYSQLKQGDTRYPLRSLPESSRASGSLCPSLTSTLLQSGETPWS